MEAATQSFASRRPAAGTLPHFTLPLPNPAVDVQIPRGVPGSDGLSPLSSGVNSSSSQSSQTGIAPYNPHGHWSLPGSQSYTYTSMNQPGPGGLIQPPFSRHQVFSPAGGPFHARNTQSPSTSEALQPPPPFGDVPSPVPGPIHGSGSGHSGMMHHQSQPQHQTSHILSSQSQTAQPPTPTTTAPLDSLSRSGQQGYYSGHASTTPQQSSFPPFHSTHASPQQHSPATTSSISRGIPAMSTGQPSPMSAQSSYMPRPYAPYGQLQSPLGPVMSNMTNPGGQMALVGGMPSMPHGYGQHIGPHHGMYGHGQPPPQQDRPFKCDTCPQSFNRNHDLKRHKRIHLAVKPFPCLHCEKSFSRKDALKRHRLVKGCGNGKTSPDGLDGSPREDSKSDGDSNSIHDLKSESS
ncbi:uncharacterized protein B0I36DRAFT_359086 [Microdochium trichocladiopsis]|uniref:C2H2-type domain-containing protein n=1 Tax=Microdochium trichocladiopsis TaxID=1682393 RepID=A0A9P9BXT9_9PEZI|nr:uncharacterized protein B0I36DRAFT_359086 [Microdochium trichocladiopsis]KAH7037378.1 hypothetical protein B0I36DRAFT_359086 [Microdochium trichocladiopsis]